MAVTAEFAPCVSCKTSNSKIASACKQCGAPLPWAKNKAVKPAPSPAGNHRVVASKREIDWGFWSVGAISLLIPIIGFLLYRSYTSNGDEKAGAAGIGALLGVFVIIGRFVYRMAT